MQPSTLVLRDIHPPVAPPWWPPAPGWWIVAGAIALVIAGAAFWRRRQRRRRVAIDRAFDEPVAQAASPSARVAVVSELLRRAARRADPQADRLQGTAWLRFLDAPVAKAGRKTSATPADAPFSDGPGRLLLDGGFRRDVSDADVDALLPVARRRYRQLMGLRG